MTIDMLLSFRIMKCFPGIDEKEILWIASSMRQWPGEEAVPKKQRFECWELRPGARIKTWMIRSMQGHSNKILNQCNISEILERIHPSHPKWSETVVHGTAAEHVQSIFREGLKPGGKHRPRGFERDITRGHVMCAPECVRGELVDGERCGIRSGSTHLVYLNATMAAEKFGVVWYLTLGDQPAYVTDQRVPPSCIIEITDRRTGEEEMPGADEPTEPRPSASPSIGAEENLCCGCNKPVRPDDGEVVTECGYCGKDRHYYGCTEKNLPCLRHGRSTHQKGYQKGS